jgi:hypothetical protein
MHKLDTIRNFQADQKYLIQSKVPQSRHIMPIAPLYFSMNNNTPIKIGQISAWKLALLANLPAEILLSKRISSPSNLLPLLSGKQTKAQINIIILSPVN